MRQLKREVKIGNVTIGGNNPIAVQTMLNVPVEDIEGNVAQAKRCEAAGCQILRVTCPSAADAKCIEAVKNAVNIPIVADIHFDYKAALACADVGVDKIRINPGNIGDDDRVKAVVQACQQKNIPIRIGVNGGSLEKHILAKYGAPVPEAMVESALYHVRLLEKFDFNNIVISIKNSNVPRMMEAYRQLSAVTDYPLHVGEIAAAGVELKYEVGTMIEIPRAALTADEIAKEADFFCFGTNDLTQMTFGFSRDDAGKFLNAYYDAKIFENDPFAKLDQTGVGKLMDMAVKLGKPVNPKLHIGICGEHGGDPSSVEFCHKIGLDYVSCSPFRVPIARLAAAQAAIANK